VADPRIEILRRSPEEAGPVEGDRPVVFYYDLIAPEAYFAAERVNAVLPVVPEWEPILLERLPGGEALDAWRCNAEREIEMIEMERLAAKRGLQPLRWPPEWPGDTELAMLAATYAKQMGRTVAFSLAAFRQAFAAARDLGRRDNVLIAAAACEMHPAAVLKGVELKSVRKALDSATAAAAAEGVRSVPAIRVGDELFTGDDGVERAAAALGA
jgi:2-hydroxychromene-2-carboxylate isomerase